MLLKIIKNQIQQNFQKNNNNTQAVTKLEAELRSSPERDEIISFVQNSGRGIMKGYKQN